jgi:hypothetical protein
MRGKPTSVAEAVTERGFAIISYKRYWRYEAITTSRYGFNVLRARGIPESPPEGEDVDGEISLFNCGVWPDHVEQMILRNNPTGISKKNSKDFQRFWRKFQTSVFTREQPLFRIEAEIAEFENWLRSHQ